MLGLSDRSGPSSDFDKFMEPSDTAGLRGSIKSSQRCSHRSGSTARKQRPGMAAPHRSSLETQPGIFVVGSPNVGKRSILSRLLSVDFEDAPDSSSGVLVHGWTINTKYYTADVSLWMAHLEEGFSLSSLPISDKLSALVMVFDMSEVSTLVALQEWVSRSDINKFEILLCIGNKVDLIPNHPVHAEYKRRLVKLSDSVDPYSDISEFGISDTEGSSLLRDEEPSVGIKKKCLEWCCDHNIEFIEACASNADFDKCLSVDGDSQGVDRIYGALSAHIWPGMILKSGDKITEPSLPQDEGSSEEESEYELEYEVLSAGSADQWEDIDQRWVSAGATDAASEPGGSASRDNLLMERDQEKSKSSNEERVQPLTSTSELQNKNDKKVTSEEEFEKATQSEDDECYEFEDLEQLMSEIGNIRGSLRLMPDFQRREMAAKLAMKMAAMFGGGSDEEHGLD